MAPEAPGLPRDQQCSKGPARRLRILGLETDSGEDDRDECCNLPVVPESRVDPVSATRTHRHTDAGTTQVGPTAALISP